MGKNPKSWNLYWVESDGIEDCFVVARNSRSACSIEANMNGFDISDAKAVMIMRIPKAAEDSYKRQKEFRDQRWPNYVYGKKFFASLGATFRTIKKQEKMLLDDVVYEVDEYAPGSIYKRRSIGLMLGAMPFDRTLYRPIFPIRNLEKAKKQI